MGTGVYALLAVLAATNLFAFVSFALDKWLAIQGARRIPERVLLGATACFGALGALAGMKLFHHKTLHRRFAVGVPVLLILQAIVLAGVAYITG